MNSDNQKQDEKDIEYTPEEEVVSSFDKKSKSVDNSSDEFVSEEENGAETIKKLREKLAIALKEKQEYLDKWQRDAAEFKNIRKRDQEDNDRFRKYAVEGILSEILPVLESFNMAFSNKEAWEKVDKNWRVGVEYIANQLKGTLEANGLKELNPVGEVFNPSLHEAVEFKEVNSASDNQKITSVIQKGYAFHDRVMKAPKVVVGEFKSK